MIRQVHTKRSCGTSHHICFVKTLGGRASAHAHAIRFVDHQQSFNEYYKYHFKSCYTIFFMYAWSFFVTLSFIYLLILSI